MPPLHAPKVGGEGRLQGAAGWRRDLFLSLTPLARRWTLTALCSACGLQGAPRLRGSTPRMHPNTRNWRGGNFAPRHALQEAALTWRHNETRLGLPNSTPSPAMSPMDVKPAGHPSWHSSHSRALIWGPGALGLPLAPSRSPVQRAQSSHLARASWAFRMQGSAKVTDTRSNACHALIAISQARPSPSVQNYLTCCLSACSLRVEPRSAPLDGSGSCGGARWAGRRAGGRRWRPPGGVPRHPPAQQGHFIRCSRRVAAAP